MHKCSTCGKSYEHAVYAVYCCSQQSREQEMSRRNFLAREREREEIEYPDNTRWHSSNVADIRNAQKRPWGGK